MTASASELQKEYALRFAASAPYRNKVWEILTRDFFQPIIGTDKVILDLGSGWAEFINNIQAGTKHAMDLNPDSRLKVAKDVSFIQQDCSQTWALPDESLDVVFTSNFFEHLPSKNCLDKTLANARRCLKKDGLLVCLGPNIRYVGNQYWDFYDHHTALSDKSLTEALRMADFSVERVIPRFLPYTIKESSRPPLFLIRLFLRLPLVWPLFGRQFLVIARKTT